ncbi:MAG: dienelactone hydrolase family protein [Salinibacterium sp.]|nr:dienelactone hydrolase family protein [Salinibacterium sp.]
MPPMLQDIAIATTLGDASPGLKGVLGIPDTPGPWPAVVVVHEAFGIEDEMRKHLAHLTGLGYLTLMPDMYTAGGFRKCIGATARALRSGTGRAWADIESARLWLSQRDDFTGSIGIIGFCLGGGFALLAAASGYHTDKTAYQAAAVNYGMLPANLDMIEHSCPVVASYGGSDRSIKNGAARLEAKYSELSVAHDVKEYPGAGHAFMNEKPVGPLALRPFLKISGIAPNPAAAVDAWERIHAFFSEHLRVNPAGAPRS